MRKFIGLNWKMNPHSQREAEGLARVSRSAGKKNKIVVFPPFVFFAAVSKTLKGNNVSVGAQDFFCETSGAYTGEISLTMIRSFGARHVIIGHSERRAMGESDALISKKLKAALSAKFIPVFCVGEPLRVKRKGRRAAEAYVRRQLRIFKKGKNIIVAYEPVWAIGTGRACPVSDAVAMAKFIKRITKTTVLYGGSVDAKNVMDFLAEKEIGGVLVGGASADFKKIRALVKKLNA